MDMSPTCLGVSELKFRNATLAVDKFHVMPYVYDAVCDVRIRIKKEISAGLSNEKRKTPEDKQVMKDMELLRRSRYALRKPQERWPEANRKVINELFTKYEDLKQAYGLSQQFRQWYDFLNRFKPEYDRLNDLHKWHQTASKMKEFEPVVKMIRKHERFVHQFIS
jgi:transposase